jgi:PAS domain S-box-containing protein
VLSVSSQVVVNDEATQAPPAPDSTGTAGSLRLFWIVGVIVVLCGAAFSATLVSDLPQELRASVSGLGLLLGGLFVAVSTGIRARKSVGARRRAWACFTFGSIIALVGNLWSIVTGADPVASPSWVAESSIGIAVVLSIAGVLSFPALRRRGIELVLLALDGLVVGGAALVMVSVLVFTEVLQGSAVGGRFEAMLYPLLDVVLVTVATLLIARSRGDRVPLTLIGLGFVLYACADVAFALLAVRATFEFGTIVDLGWILGYLMLGWAACYPRNDSASQTTAMGTSDVLGTVLIFSVLLLAAVVRNTAGEMAALNPAQTAMWLILLFSAGARQVILGLDNDALRRGLERRVQEQTTDLRHLARQNEVLLTSVADGIYGVDDDGRITFVNPAGAALLGYPVETLAGHRAHQAFHAPTEAGNPHPWQGCYITESIHDGVVTSAEEDAYVRADGSQIPVEITCSPLLDGPNIQGAVVAFRDITQRREVDRIKNEFLSVVSHELRTPLTSIRGSLGLLSAGSLGELSPPAQRMAAIALDSSERLTRLINDILDMERIESGTMPMNFAEQHASNLIRVAVGEIEGLAQESGVTVETVAAEGRVVGDSDRIVQTLTNLLGNAIKFSPPGGVVRVSAVEQAGQVRFQVADEGRGIPEEKLERIFDRFEQVDSSDTRLKGGSGLGLAISRGIVERHGGRIWAESQQDVGTVVSFDLPATKPTLRHTGPEVDDDAPLILVCDDDSNVVETLSEMLRRHGYRPIGVTDGADAVEGAIAHRPAAVLTDLLMSDTSGGDVVTRLREEERTRHIPIVVVSGLGPSADPKVADSTDSWLVKPVTEEQLATTVADAVARRRRDTSVLVVEDDTHLASVLIALLRSHGLEVSHAETAADAVRRAQETSPEVIVLDLRLPDGAGADVVSELRQDSVLANTQVVVYSAAEVTTEQREELKLGRTVFLNKGHVAPSELEDQVLELVDDVTALTRGRR